MASRWRREEYDVVKHDSCFSDWKVLVGASDWKEQASSGRERAERFRSRNLPSPHVGAGVYELGVTLPAWKTPDSGSIKSEDIVVVYVGHADHIRKRLLRYGQAGAYLEGTRSPNSSTTGKENQGNKSPFYDHERQLSSGEEPMMSKQRQSYGVNIPRSSSGRRSSRIEKQLSIPGRSLSPIAEPASPRGPRLFSEVFALGCSIAYRWASTRTKDVAEFVVSELTEAFDYAWNRGGDSDLRSQDILGKIVLGKRGSYDSSCCNRNNESKWQFLFKRKPVGIKITAHKPTEVRMRRRSSQRGDARGLCMLLKKSPHLMIVGGKSAKHCEFTKIDIPVDRCGIMLENGLVCNALPQKGRKRCQTHMDAKRQSRRKASQVAAESRSGSLASEAASFDLQKPSGLPVSTTPSSCFPFLLSRKPKQQEPRKRGSVSFSTWLSRSELLKAKSLEWLLAMEEIKGRGNNINNHNNNTDCSTSPILKPVVLSPEIKANSVTSDPPVRVSRISLNLNHGMAPADQTQDIYRPKVDNGMPYTIVSRRSSVPWPPAPLRESYATSFTASQYPRISFS